MWLKCKDKKKLAVYGEGAVTDWIRCGLWSFLLDGRPVEIDSGLNQDIIENTQCYTTGGIADIHKYPSQALKSFTPAWLY